MRFGFAHVVDDKIVRLHRVAEYQVLQIGWPIVAHFDTPDNVVVLVRIDGVGVTARSLPGVNVSAGLDDLRLGFVQRQHTRASRICMAVIRVAARCELDAAFDRPVCLNQPFAAKRLIPYDVKLDRERA